MKEHTSLRKIIPMKRSSPTIDDSSSSRTPITESIRIDDSQIHHVGSASYQIEDPRISRSSELMYDASTWRMYHRIMNSRRKRAPVLQEQAIENRRSINYSRTESTQSLSLSNPDRRDGHAKDTESALEYSMGKDKTRSKKKASRIVPGDGVFLLEF